MKKVICFTRVSTTAQDLEPQKKAVKNAILSDGFKEDEIAYVEGKESGFKDEEERETIKLLKQALEDNPEAKDIYIFAIDRLARRVSIFLSIKENILDKNGINLTFLNPYRASTMIKENGEYKKSPYVEVMLLFLSVGASMEMEIKKARFAATKAKMKAQGQIISGSPIYGYYTGEDNYPVIKEDEAKVVRFIFDQYGNKNDSVAEILNKLYEKGWWKNENNSRSKYITVRNMLNNLAYSGRSEKKYAPIVSVELQDKAIARLKDKNKERKVESTVFWGKGIVKTLFDGKYFGMAGQTGTCTYRYLSINKETNAVNANVIDSILWNEAKYWYTLLLKQRNKEGGENRKKKIEECEKGIKKNEEFIEAVKARMNKAFKVFMSGKVSEETYNEQYNELEKEERGYRARIAELESNIESLKNEEERLANMDEKLGIKNWFNLCEELDSLDDNRKYEIIHEAISMMKVEQIGKKEYKMVVEPNLSIMPECGIQYYYIYKSSGCRIDVKMYHTSQEEAVKWDMKDIYIERIKRIH